MNNPQTKTNPNEDQRPEDGNACAAEAKHDSANPAPSIEHSVRIAPNAARNSQRTNTQHKNKTRTQKFCDWIWTITPGDVALGIVAIFAVWIAYWQNSLVGEANRIADQSAAASKSATDIAAKALDLAVAGAEESRKTATALQQTAEANIKTADAAKQAAAAAAGVLKKAQEANEIAQAAARAAEKTAKATDESVRLARATAIRQLRAYITVMGSDLIYDHERKEVTILVTLENTGHTPAHDVSVSAKFYCWPLNKPVPTNTRERPSPRSIGPQGRFRFKDRMDFTKNDLRELEAERMGMWMEGTVTYTHEFDRTKKRETNFKFVPGKRISSTQWDVVYDKDGNGSN